MQKRSPHTKADKSPTGSARLLPQKPKRHASTNKDHRNQRVDPDTQTTGCATQPMIQESLVVIPGLTVHEIGNMPSGGRHADPSVLGDDRYPDVAMLADALMSKYSVDTGT